MSITTSVGRTPQVSILPIFIAILLALIIIILAALFLTRRNQPRAPRPTGIKALGLIFGLVSLGLIIVATPGYRRVEKPGFCGNCHRGKAAASMGISHPNMNCLSCHARPGIVGRFAWRVDFAAKVAALKLTGKMPPGRVRPGISSKTCLSPCHEKLKTGAAGSGRIRVRHAELLGAGYACLDCHPQINHGLVPASNRRTIMAKCDGCHNGTKAPGDCRVCHTGRTDPSGAAILTKYRKVQLTEPFKCGSCHVSEACNRCHNLGLLPHSASWKRGRHQKEGSERRAECLKCHTEEDCLECHEPSPHKEANWLLNHRQVGQLQNPGCNGCHTDGFCRQCHEDVGLPGPG